MTTTLTAREGTGTEAPTSTGSPASRWLGVASLTGLALVLLFAFWFTEPDERVDEATNIVTGQFDAVRLIYVHVPVAVVAYLAFSVTAVGSAMVLWKKSQWWDNTAAASAEIGVLFCALTLITGSIWGRPIWNTWWEWGDVRLMTTAILFLIFVGYLAYRRTITDHQVRAKRSAIVGIVGAINIPIVNRSVEWWESRTLHQKSTLAELKAEDLTLFAMIFSIFVFSAIYLWLMIHRFRVGWLEHQAASSGLVAAIAERRAQTSTAVAEAVGDRSLADRGTGAQP